MEERGRGLRDLVPEIDLAFLQHAPGMSYVEEHGVVVDGVEYMIGFEDGGAPIQVVGLALDADDDDDGDQATSRSGGDQQSQRHHGHNGHNVDNAHGGHTRAPQSGGLRGTKPAQLLHSSSTFISSSDISGTELERSKADLGSSFTGSTLDRSKSILGFGDNSFLGQSEAGCVFESRLFDVTCCQGRSMRR